MKCKKCGDESEFIFNGCCLKPSCHEDIVPSAALPPSVVNVREYVTLRDEFAMAALTGLLAAGCSNETIVAEAAYYHADAMMEERGKKKDEA